MLVYRWHLFTPNHEAMESADAGNWSILFYFVQIRSLIIGYLWACVAVLPVKVHIIITGWWKIKLIFVVIRKNKITGDHQDFPYHVSMCAGVFVQICLSGHFETSLVYLLCSCSRCILTAHICSSGCCYLPASTTTMFCEPWVQDLYCQWISWGWASNNLLISWL